mgnify:CR=1 FL=1
MSARTARDVIANAFGVKEVFGHRENEPCELCLNTADAILSALRSAGWAVVPVEPTGEMRKAGENAPNTRLASHVWRAMLKAAQEDSRG